MGASNPNVSLNWSHLWLNDIKEILVRDDKTVYVCINITSAPGSLHLIWSLPCLWCSVSRLPSPLPASCVWSSASPRPPGWPLSGASPVQSPSPGPRDLQAQEHWAAGLDWQIATLVVTKLKLTFGTLPAQSRQYTPCCLRKVCGLGASF